ncbi:TatD family hydrolase [Gammaproteobacteria bacterium]|nr:TatD family hydrolase [Gammaproteobacteria bacterium]
MRRLIDTHCHLDNCAFDADRDRVLAACRALGIEGIVVPAVDAAGWPNLLALCEQEPMLRPALGLHPIYSARHRDTDLLSLESQVRAGSPLAIGEIGLDFFVADADRERQLILLDAQLAIAEQAGLPVILHCRKAHDLLLQRMKRFNLVGGIAHAFNGSFQQATRFIDAGFHLGYGGMLTYPRSRRIRDTAKRLPLDAIVLETDAPDMTVSAHQGQRNSPAYLPMCLSALADLRCADHETVAEATCANAYRALAMAAIQR